MLCNVFTIRKDINGNNYIQIINPDYRDTNSWKKYWHSLIFSLKEIISNWEYVASYFYYDFFSEEDINCILYMYRFGMKGDFTYIITTLHGEIKITTYHPDIIEADGNTELLYKIISLLESSSYFLMMVEDKID
ncbi:MAG: hypothetical protein FWF38_01965 [Spirochaetaceae bacterium]|nr:hypothetical protein [Spirochaetaceae bacterium]